MRDYYSIRNIRDLNIIKNTLKPKDPFSSILFFKEINLENNLKIRRQDHRTKETSLKILKMTMKKNYFLILKVGLKIIRKKNVNEENEDIK